jgi:hypothetical protein
VDKRVLEKLLELNESKNKDEVKDSIVEFLTEAFQSNFDQLDLKPTLDFEYQKRQLLEDV